MSANETKTKLLKAGIKLFSKYGYESTTTRMIAAEADVNIGSITFHYQNKENFYKQVLEYAAQDAIDFFEEFQQEVKKAEDENALDHEKALYFISRLIELQLQLSIDSYFPDYLNLLYWEQMQPAGTEHPITDVAFTYCEQTLAFLIRKYEPAFPREQAVVLSRFINGGVISYGEHPVFMDILKKQLPEGSQYEYIKDTLLQFIVSSIQQYCKKERIY